MLIMVKSPPNYNNRVKITNMNSNSNSFTNLINHCYLFFIYSLIIENSLNLFLWLHIYIYIYI